MKFLKSNLFIEEIFCIRLRKFRKGIYLGEVYLKKNNIKVQKKAASFF